MQEPDWMKMLQEIEDGLNQDQRNSFKCKCDIRCQELGQLLGGFSGLSVHLTIGEVSHFLKYYKVKK